MERHPTLLHVMTPFPQYIGTDASLDEAREMMDDHRIHHLPVKDEDGQLVGLITDVDLAMAATATEQGAALDVGAVCRRDIYVVDVNRTLASVAREMGVGRANSVLVTRDGHLVGIVTTTDVCRVLADLLDDDIDDIIA